MTPENKATLFRWAKTLVMVVAFGGMFFAINKLVRSYSLEQIEVAFADMPVALVVAAVGVLVCQHALLAVREWLAVRYAGSDLSPRRIGFGSLIIRSLGSLGVATITGVGLRLRIYGGWKLGTADVARITTYNELTFIVGHVARVAVVFSLVPVPTALAGWIGVVVVRGLGVGAALLAGGYLWWAIASRKELCIRSLVIRAPNAREAFGSLSLPVLDLALTAAIIHLCLPAAVPLSYLDVVVVALVASVAGSLTQIPAGLGVLEGITLLFVSDSTLAPLVIAGLLVRRLITDVLPIVVGAAALVGLELHRKGRAPPPVWLAAATARALSSLLFVAGVVLMFLAAVKGSESSGVIAPLLVAGVGTALLFVARGIEQRSRRAWQLALVLLVGRAVACVVVAPPLPIVGVLLVVGALLAMSRSAFRENRDIIDASPRWWIAFALAIAGTLWVTFVEQGRELTQQVVAAGGVMLAIASIALAAAIFYTVRSRSRPVDTPDDML